MNAPLPAERAILMERYAERWALNACRSATFSGCLKAFGVAPAIKVSTARGKTLTISASDVYAARRRYLVGLEPGQEFHTLTSTGDSLVERFLDWLLHEYSARYRSIAAHDQRSWLRQVATLVIARHLMEQKYARYLEQGRQSFADPWVCGEMCRLHILHALPGELARLVHHIVREPERQRALIDQFHGDLEARLRGSLPALPEALPPLPVGARRPFALFSQAQGGEPAAGFAEEDARPAPATGRIASGSEAPEAEARGRQP